MKFSLREAVLLFISALTVSTDSWAQFQPDAGSVLRQSEQSFQDKKIAPPVKRHEVPLAPLAGLEQATVTVSSFRVDGATLLTREQLEPAVTPFLRRALTFTDLQLACEAVATAYRDAGWIVRAYLPKQEINQGVVTIQVVEAVFGEVSIASTSEPRVEASQLIALVNEVQAKGEYLNAKKIDRALLLLDDLPGVSVSGNLVEGKEHSETDLALVVTNEALLAGTVTTDNNGSVSTGEARLSANFALNSPLSMGDSLVVNLLKTQGSEYQRTAYTWPLGGDGWRTGFHVSNLNYKVVTGPSTGALGVSESAGIDITYPILRSQLRNVNFSLSSDQKHFVNKNMLGTLSSDYAINGYTLGLNSVLFDEFLGGGVNAVGINVTHGYVIPAQSGLAPTDNGVALSGRYNKVNLNLSRQQTITENLSLYLQGTWQAASQMLDSSERLYLGGVTGVRAYPSSEGSGREGRLLSTELRQRLGDRWALTGFYDYGRVSGTQVINASMPSRYKLEGYGFSLAWQAPGGVDLKATVAKRLGLNPVANADGTDGDGTYKLRRAWVSASVTF